MPVTISSAAVGVVLLAPVIYSCGLIFTQNMGMVFSLQVLYLRSWASLAAARYKMLKSCYFTTSLTHCFRENASCHNDVL